MQVGKSKFFVGGLVAAALFGSGAAHAANLVVNGDFETQDFTGWTTTGLLAGQDGVDGSAPHDGTYAAFFGNFKTISTISQTLATVAGGKYDVKFWLANEADPFAGVAGPNSFSFGWGAATVASLTNAPALGYTKFEYLVTASAASTSLSFSFHQVPGIWDFDTVSVTSVPEPSTLALMTLGGALVVLTPIRRRLLRSAAA